MPWPKKIFYSLIILLLPFVLFYQIIPFFAELNPGNDFQIFFSHQLELMFSLKSGSFPLYIPGFAGGHSAAALTIGQIYHPLPHIAAIFPCYWSGKAMEIVLFLRFLSLAAAHLFLFFFLKKLKITPWAALSIAAVTVYNLRMLDLLRFGPSLESWTGSLFLCSAIGFFYLKPDKFKGLLICVATYLLVCSGHPQMMYYGLLGAGLFAIILPFFVNLFISNEQGNLLRSQMRFWLQVGGYCGLGILLSAAYIIPYYFDFILENAERVGQGYSWADQYGDTVIGTLNNFFQPLYSDVNSAFGGSSLFILSAMVPFLPLFRVKVPRIIWAIWGLCLVVFLHMQGARTPVHFLFWKYLPLASSFRIAGRIAMILPLFLMLILAWLTTLKPLQLKYFKKNILISPFILLAILSMIFIGLYLILPNSITTATAAYAPVKIRQIPSYAITAIQVFGLSSLLLLCLFIATSPKRKNIFGILLFFVVCSQLMFLMKYGSWVLPKWETPTYHQMLFRKSLDLRFGSEPGGGLVSKVVARQTEQSFLEPFIGKVYRKYLVATDNYNAFELMAQGRSPDQVVIEQIPVSLNFKEKCSADLSKTSDLVRLTYSSFNRLILEANSSCPGFFGLGYPYTKNWNAKVNGKDAIVYCANGGSSCAVQIPAGQSEIEFRYWSWPSFCGIVISCVALLIAGFFAGFREKRKLKYFINIISVIAGCGMGFLWYTSLYSGKNLHTNYSWSSSALENKNIAFSKRTTLSSMIGLYPYLVNSGRAVDGYKDAGAGFTSDIQSDPFWMVDLYHQKEIGTIKIFESRYSQIFNLRPLIIAISNDGENWMDIASVQRHEPVLTVEFKKPVIARYLRITATGYCYLSFDEVEVYSSTDF